MTSLTRRPIRTTAALLITVAVAGSPGLIAPAALAAPPTEWAVSSQAAVHAVITGRLLNKGAGAPGVNVYLFDRKAERQLGKVTSDADGRYRFEGVAKGRYLIRTAGSRVNNTLPTLYGDTVHWARGGVVKVTRSTTYVRDVNLTPGATITGQLLDQDGKPVADRWILANNTTRFGYAGTSTDGEGRYRLSGLATGPVALIASDEDPDDNCDGEGILLTLTVVQGQVLEAPAARVRDGCPTGTVTGRIAGWDPDRRVTVSLVPVGEREGRELVPDDDGVVRGGAVPGRYRIYLNGVKTRSDVVTVTDAATVDFGTLTLPRQATTVKGHVVYANGAVCARCRLTITDAYGTRLGGATRTSKTGRYAFSTGAAAGRYVITVVHERRPGEVGSDIITKRSLTVTKGATSVRKNVRLNEGYKLIGRVLYNGKPVWNVSVVPGPTLAVKARKTASDGEFRFRHIPPGKHRFTLTEQVRGGYRTRVATVTVKGHNRTGVILDLAKLPFA